MAKKAWVGLIILVAMGALVFTYIRAAIIFFPQQQPAATVSFNPLNATYIIDGQAVTLVNGAAATPSAPGSAAMVTTTVFGTPATGDLNGDGLPDAALIIEQQPGGSGTFYYLAAAVNSPAGAVGTYGFLLGDRIAPQNIEIASGTIIANYADRKPGQPMSATPSVGVTKKFYIN